MKRKSLIFRFFIFTVLLCGLLGLTLPLFAQSIAISQPFSSASSAPIVNKDAARASSIFSARLLQLKVIETLLLIMIAYVILISLVGIINKRIRDIRARHIARKNTIYIIHFLLLISIVIIWLQNINYITIILGFASAGIALALQEVILCVAGWVFIISRRPFETGDRVEINGIRGDVIDIRIMQTSLLEVGNWVEADQSTGRIVNIPNSSVFKTANFNYNRGFEFIWNEIPILVTFESDWKRARDIMMTHAKKLVEGSTNEVQRKIEIMKNRYMIYYGKLTPIVYVTIQDSGVLLTLRYLTEAKRRRSTQDQLSQAILEDFALDPSVNFAYPTYRIVKT